MKMTIRKIAELSGVSRGTVDKVVHDREGVSNEVRTHVQKIIDEFGYKLPTRKPKEIIQQVEPERSYRVAVLSPRLTNPFFEKVIRGMQDALMSESAQSVHAEYFHCDSENVNEQLSILYYLEEHGIDGILLRGTRNQRLCDRINHLTEKGIPIVLFDSGVPGSKRLCFVGENSGASSRVAASLLAKSIGEEGEVAIISGLPDMSTHRARVQGFEQVMRERFPKICIVEKINSRDQSVIAYEKTRYLLRQYPHLRGIFNAVGCTGDIGQALIDQQAQHIKMVCYNMTPDIVALVKRGIVDFAIGLAPYQQGFSAMNAMTAYLTQGKQPAAFIELPQLIGIDENIEALAKTM